MEKDSADGTVSESSLCNVIAVVAVESGKPESSITADSKLEDLGMDSLDFVALMQALDIPDAKWQGIVTVADVLKAMQ